MELMVECLIWMMLNALAMPKDYTNYTFFEVIKEVLSHSGGKRNPVLVGI